MYNGFAMAIVRSGQTPGKVTVKVTGNGLKTAEKVITVK
ncbi:MAG: hypothetical protein ACK5NK_15275 [Niabella sp.]